jgi:2,4-dienoyl-CoA reductase-like NADH-dependent reductase (Old Yellow Enzyme family)
MPTAISDASGRSGAMWLRWPRSAPQATTPVVLAGVSGLQAEGLLTAGADIVGAARQSLADPDWWEKVRLGRGAEVRRCDYTNYCEGLDQMHKQVTCQLWDRAFKPGDGVPLAKDGKRRLLAP